MSKNSSLTPAQNQDRLNSLDRANKMSVLFRKENFVNVMKEVELYEKAKTEGAKGCAEEAQKNFIIACETAGLNEDQTKWLWNYLEHYKQENDWACPGGGW